MSVLQALLCSYERAWSAADRALLWDLAQGEPLRTLRRDRPYERLNITGIRGLSEAQKASLRALGAFEETSSLVECIASPKSEAMHSRTAGKQPGVSMFAR